jgi:signal transduction histidine kinase
LSFTTSSENTVLLEVSAHYLEYNGQKLIQAIARDVTIQRQLSDKLIQTDKLVLLGQLSAGIAHEIRNPLSAVNINLQVLQRLAGENEDQLRHLTPALQGVERIAKIVESTLNFSRAIPPVTKQEQINTVIVNALDLVTSAFTFKRKNISVQLDLQQELKEVWIDARQIQQVLINLLTNAADAIVTRGTIRISTSEESNARGSRMVTVAISDSGGGIPPEDMQKIFDPFFTRKADGTGLGLPISHRIVMQHNGSLEVESVLEEGTTFYMKLPIKI